MKAKKKQKLVKSFLEIRLEDSGIEINKSNNVISRVNPLDKLLVAGDLTKEKWQAGYEYQFNYELASVSNHARPSYNDSRSTKTKEFELNQSQIRAYSRITESKLEISKNYRYLEILSIIFENQQSINFCEKKTGMNHKNIKEIIIKICEILLQLKNPNLN